MKKTKISYGFWSIRNRLLVFSILVTLVPSFSVGWLLNAMIRTTMTEKVEQKLLDSASYIERELALWMRERNHDLRVFSNSFVIAENFNRYLNDKNRKEPKGITPPEYTRNIITYLTSVQKQFNDYTRLFVLDNEGNVVAVSGNQKVNRPFYLPEDMEEQIKANQHFRGEVYFEEPGGAPLMMFGIPLLSKQYDVHVGLLAIEVRLQGVLPLMETALSKTKDDVPSCGFLIRLKDGVQFLTNCKDVDSGSPVSGSDKTLHLFDQPSRLQEFIDHQGVQVVAIAKPMKQLQWGLVISENRDQVFARVAQSRNRNILIVSLFSLLILLAAYRLARQIVIPLTALTDGALRVTNGDLNVRLSIQKKDEVGFATEVFNNMVIDLQQNRKKLEQLATTDSLTKLVNRKQLLQNLSEHFNAYQRYMTKFSILVIDIDHFKKINDTYGHPAGDAVLIDMAAVFMDSVRTIDVVGRYGGEEFLVILTRTDEATAMVVAERIRQSVKEHTFIVDNNRLAVTISIGVTEVLKSDSSESDLINRADKALYKAKESGRDRVICTDQSVHKNDKCGQVG